MSRIKNIFSQLKKTFFKNPIANTILLVLIIAGSWLRLYRLSSTIMFQGDQGRDALIVAKMFKDFDLAFVGPVTSIGNMYLGPFYYYFMLPFFANFLSKSSGSSSWRGAGKYFGDFSFLCAWSKNGR